MRTSAWLLLALAACKPVEEAPADIAELLSRLWLAWPEGSDEELGNLALSLADLADEDALLDGHIDGEHTRFGAEHLEMVTLGPPPDDDGSWTPPDPAAARALFILNRYTCELDQLERILYHLEQGELYNSYDTYERSYLGDIDAYKARRETRIGWEGLATASYPIVGSYEQALVGNMRRAPLPSEQPPGREGDLPAWTPGDFLTTRTWLPFPASFNQDGRSYEQDYQLEMYIPWDGDIIHLYGVWRQVDFGPLGDIEGTAVSRTLLNGLVGWDRDTEKLCEQGLPE